MDSFIIKSSRDKGMLAFFDRLPIDKDRPIEEFSVRISAHNLTASGRVYAGYASSHPAEFFASMARAWSGWNYELTWESLERELRLACRHDRLGHIAIRVELRSGFWEHDWLASATIMSEAGQLESIAKHASSFFGLGQ